MTSMYAAHYALQRQQIAVLRVLYARSPAELDMAARWAGAWHRLVQHKLAQAGGLGMRTHGLARKHQLH